MASASASDKSPRHPGILRQDTLPIPGSLLQQRATTASTFFDPSPFLLDSHEPQQPQPRRTSFLLPLPTPSTRRPSASLATGLPPLPSPTFSELFFLESDHGPSHMQMRGPSHHHHHHQHMQTPRIVLTPAVGPSRIFWGNDDADDDEDEDDEEEEEEDVDQKDEQEDTKEIPPVSESLHCSSTTTTDSSPIDDGPSRAAESDTEAAPKPHRKKKKPPKLKPQTASSPWHLETTRNGLHTSYLQLAIASHAPTMPDEIGISVGDECEIYKRFHDGWIHGRNRSTNKIGIFPGGCLTCLTPPGGLPPFMSSALRQDSMMSMKSFVSSSSQWMYGPPTESPPEKSETGSYTIEIEEDAPKPTARRRRQQRAQILKKAAIMVTAMIIALTLVLGLGVVLGGHIFEKQHPSLWAHVSV